jgi:carbon storage regulator CsrA
VSNAPLCSIERRSFAEAGVSNDWLERRRDPVLVLTRKRNQSIVLTCDDAEVTLKIIQVGRDKVSVGVEAPLSVKVLRAELQSSEPAA